MTAVLVGSTGCQTVSLISAKGLTGGSLPPCVGKPPKSEWHGCYGTSLLSNGEKYVGEYMDDKYHGQGTVTFVAPHDNAGSKYVGEFENDKPHGQGTLTVIAPNELAGLKYVGELENGLPHGQGTATLVAPHKLAGLKYVGGWRRDRHHGQGTLTDERAGLKYVGGWRGDRHHGQGTMTFVAPHKLEGLEFIGEWRDNKLISRVVVKPPLNRCYVFKARSSKRIKGCKDALLNTDKFEEKCSELGFTKGTEKFGDCVMKLFR
jgi:hypothetical protein